MKKIMSAILTLFLLVGTFSPVLALKLKDYPQFLVQNNRLNTYVVVGSDAKTEDVVGAVDLAVRLASENQDKIPLPKSVELLGGEEKEIPLGEKLTFAGGFSSILDDSDINGLKDSTVDFLDENIDYHEEIKLGVNSPSVETSLTSSENDYEDNIVIEAERNSMAYYFVFDEDVNLTLTTQGDPLEIEILGKRMKIIETKSSNTFTVQTGETYYLEEGQSQTIQGKVVTLINAGSGNKVMIDVDGKREIASDVTKDINGLKVKVLSVFEGDKDFAEVIIGDEVSKSYKDGDSFIGEDKNDPNWVWVLSDLTTKKPVIGVKNDFVKNDETDNPVELGKCYVFPMNYTQVCFTSVNVEDSKYEGYELDYDNSVDLDKADDLGMNWSSSEKAFVLNSLSSEKTLLLDKDSSAWIVRGTKFTEDKETNKIYLFAQDTSLGDVSIFFRDKNNEVVFAGKVRNDNSTDDNLIGYLNYRNTKGVVELRLRNNLMTNNLRFVYFNNIVSDDISAHIHTDGTRFNALGNVSDTSESSELMWTTTNIGTKDKDLKTRFGAVIENPDNKGSSDRVVVRFPEERVKAKISIMGLGSKFTEETADYYYKSVPIVDAIAKLDTEIPSPETVDRHMILIGDSAVNRLSAKIRGLPYPTYGSSGLLPYGQGEGEITVFENGFKQGYNVVLVSGWEATDTRRGCLALLDFSNKLKDIDTSSAKITTTGLVPKT